MTNKNTADQSLRLEELMKKALSDAPKLEIDIVETEIEKYLSDIKEDEVPRYLLLVSREIGYYQVFDNVDNLTPKEVAKHIVGFLSDSRYVTDDGSFVSMDEVTEIDNSEDVVGLDLWIRKVYFQLAPFDWGVERVE